MKPYYSNHAVTLYHGKTEEVLPTLPKNAFDYCFTDPPYPGIKRDYGEWTEEEWFGLMRTVTDELRRVLRPKGSATMVLAPNSERLGQMRLWLWEYVAWAGRRWNLVQDAYWLNPSVLPTMHSRREVGLMRPCLKTLVWLGAADCYKNQDLVLVEGSQHNKMVDLSDRTLRIAPSGRRLRQAQVSGSVFERGGASPYNCLVIANTDATHNRGHGAQTPIPLTSWWIRYACPPKGHVIEPFSGSGTTLLTAQSMGRFATGIEQHERYCETAARALEKLAEKQRDRGSWTEFPLMEGDVTEGVADGAV